MTSQALKKLIKMADMVKRTGVKKETIHFYIHKGLLHRPLKTSRNMAYYDESHIERIRLIKELQLKQFLPLKVIKELLSKPEDQLTRAELELIRKGEADLVRLERRRGAYEPLSLADLGDKTGLPAGEIEAMEQCEMISSAPGKDGEKFYADTDIRIVEAFAEMRKSGLTKEAGFEVEEFRLQSDLISMMATEEVKIFARKFAERLSLEEAQEILPKIVEQAVESVGAFIWYLRKKKILEAVHKFAEGGDQSEAKDADHPEENREN